MRSNWFDIFSSKSAEERPRHAPLQTLFPGLTKIDLPEGLTIATSSLDNSDASVKQAHNRCFLQRSRKRRKPSEVQHMHKDRS